MTHDLEVFSVMLIKYKSQWMMFWGHVEYFDVLNVDNISFDKRQYLMTSHFSEFWHVSMAVTLTFQ